MRLGSGEDDDNLNDDSERRRRMDGIFSNNDKQAIKNVKEHWYGCILCYY